MGIAAGIIIILMSITHREVFSHGSTSCHFHHLHYSANPILVIVYKNSLILNHLAEATKKTKIMNKYNIAVIVGSLRKESYNLKIFKTANRYFYY